MTDRMIGQLKPKNLIVLGKEFSLEDAAILMAVEEIQKNLPAAKETIENCCDGRSFCDRVFAWWLLS